MLSQLLNLPVTITRRSVSGDLDAYGNDTDDVTTVETVGELQQRQRSEPDDHGELSDTGWLLILPAGTDVDTGDAVEADGQVFELVGAPWEARNPRTGMASHIEATLRRTAGAEDGS